MTTVHGIKRHVTHGTSVLVRVWSDIGRSSSHAGPGKRWRKAKWKTAAQAILGLLETFQ